MYKKLLLVIIALLSINITYGVCSLNNFDDTCSHLNSPYQTFNIDIEPENEIYDLEVSIYKKGLEGNKILLENIGGNEYRNIEPIINFGAYILEVKATSLSSHIFTNEYEFIYDNSKPSQPLIKTNLISNENTIDIQGKTNPNNQIIVYNKLGTEIRRTSANSLGEFSINLNLNENINYFAFSSLNLFGVESQKTKRIVYYTYPQLLKTSTINSITINELDTVNENTIKVDDKYVTSSKNFYIEGSVNGNELLGNRVFLNGVSTITDVSGNFAGFVTLNEGENNLEIKSGNIKENIEIVYLNSNFKFTSNPISNNKVTSQNNLAINGNVNIDSSFNAYLNSKYLGEIETSNLRYNIDLIDLEPGRNTLYLQGPNGEYFLDYIYYDETNPTIEVLNDINELVFKISDDTGIDYNTLDVEIGDTKITKTKIESKSDYFKVDLSNFKEGLYETTISVSDKSQRESTKIVTLQISSDYASIKNIEFEDKSILIGNQIFTKTRTQKISLIPNKNIAFESIYLDDIEITNYEINFDNSIDVTLDFNKEEGKLIFNLIDSSYEPYIQEFKYKTNIEKPQIKLNYAFKSGASQNSIAIITGEIISDNFDWETFTINGKNNFERYGNLFEAYISVDSISNNILTFGGNELTGESFEKNQFGDILLKDENGIDIEIDKVSNYITGSISNPLPQIDNMVYEYDGYTSSAFYINSDSFQLSPNDREGIRASNIKGISSTGNKFSENGIISIDNTKPKIFFQSSSNDITKIIVDTTYSQIKTINITNQTRGETKKIEYGECLNFEKISIYSYCYEVETDNFEVKVIDKANNTQTKKYETNDNKIYSLTDTDFKIYFNGNDLITNKRNQIIQGQISTSFPLANVKVGDGNCEFDDENFACPVNLNDGSNSFTITGQNIKGQTTSKTINFELVLGIEVSLNEINLSEGIYKMGDSYYINVNDYLDALGFVNKESIIDVIIGEKTQNRILSNEGNLSIKIDINDRVLGKQTDTFETYLRAEDNEGNTKSSNRIRIFFDTVSKTILNIIAK